MAGPRHRYPPEDWTSPSGRSGPSARILVFFALAARCVKSGGAATRRKSGRPDVAWNWSERRSSSIAKPNRMDSKKARHISLTILALCFVLSMLARGVTDSFGVFLLPIVGEFGW